MFAATEPNAPLRAGWRSSFSGRYPPPLAPPPPNCFSPPPPLLTHRLQQEALRRKDCPRAPGDEQNQRECGVGEPPSPRSTSSPAARLTSSPPSCPTLLSRTHLHSAFDPSTQQPEQTTAPTHSQSLALSQSDSGLTTWCARALFRPNVDGVVPPTQHVNLRIFGQPKSGAEVDCPKAEACPFHPPAEQNR